MNQNKSVPIDTPAAAVVHNLAEFGSDFAALAELQTKLAVIDLKESAGRVALPAVALAGASILALGSVPVLLDGVARLINHYYPPINFGWALLLTAGVALVLAAAIGGLAASRIGPSFASFQRSGEELARNIAWIKTVLAYSGRSAPSQRRRA